MRHLQNSARVLFTGVFLLVSLLPLCAQSSSQERPQPQTASSTSAKAPAAAAHEAGAGEKPAEQSDTEALKQSPSVQKLANMLHISVEAAYWFSVVLNFVLIALLLAVMIKKSVPGLLRARGESIRKQMDDAQRTSEEATQRLNQIEARLGRLGGEIAALQAEAVAQEQSEEARFKQAAEEEKQRVLRSAQQEIASAATAARRDLRAYAAELAVDLAEKKIKVDSSTDQNLVRDFAEQLGRNGN